MPATHTIPPPLKKSAAQPGYTPTASILRTDDEAYAAIDDYDQIPPFFCSLTSDSNLWLFVSSTGSLTAGRREADHAILPYETVDKIHDNGPHTGPVALLRWRENGRQTIWEPFQGPSFEGAQRRLLKNLIGSRMVFEETLTREKLVFTSTLMISDRFGLVRECSLRNEGTTAREIEVLHGIRNLVPSGVSRRIQNELSCLADAYKQNEILPGSGLGIFSMASGLTDQPIPCESLRATIAWSCGLPSAQRGVDGQWPLDFAQGKTPAPSPASRGVRANFFEWACLKLKPNEVTKWLMVCDTGLDQTAVDGIHRLIEDGLPIRDVLEDVTKGETSLRRRLAAADGLQQSGDSAATAHHLANVLFNVMRGGIFANGSEIKRDDFRAFLADANGKVHQRHSEWLSTLPPSLRREHFKEKIRGRGCPQLKRLFLEYLPIAFSRRHGDPSRPWNQFTIQTRDRDGNEVLFYQGNWRDIFQNWEALALSFPEYLEGMIGKFVNASTADGHNPYRISRDGIDWEKPEPEDPWACFGYWGDHQIVYLTKLLEACEQHYPGTIASLLGERRFTYANVPYRIKPLPAILRDPRNTLEFDAALSDQLMAAAKQEGSDAKLIQGPDGLPALVTFMEKLLVPVLAKWSRFLPGGGIWMNTQRPEWNDANNALVGNGLSMVTLCQLRRHQEFLLKVVGELPETTFDISSPVADWLERVRGVLAAGDPEADSFSAARRREILLALGHADEACRTRVGAGDFTHETTGLSSSRIVEFLTLLMKWADATILANRRSDGLFHSYNLMVLEDDGATIRHLDAMLEGHVAILSAGILSPAESGEVLDALRQSDLYCPRRRSYLLYPDREAIPFLSKNRLPSAEGRKSLLLTVMIERGDDRIIHAESDSVWRFHPDLRNAGVLREKLEAFEREGVYDPLPRREKKLIEDLYESVFGHHAFTGRSGSMFAYEGLGSIYWHMVSKLLLAAQENLVRARTKGNDPVLTQWLDGHYSAIRDGLGFRKTAGDYGAFPTDPYSHTPGHAGAQQPGMTGQVKEEILTRRGEFGIWVRDGRLVFETVHACSQKERTGTETVFHPINLEGLTENLPLPAGSLACTVCQTPVIRTLRAGNRSHIRVHLRSGETRVVEGHTLGREDSLSIFRRDGRIHFLEVFPASPWPDTTPQPGA